MQFPAHASAMVLWGLLITGRLASAQTWDLAALRAFAGFSADQWNAADGGDPQVRVLDTQEKREVAVIGVARVRATSACFIARLQDIENFKKNPAVLRIGKFTTPVQPRDLDRFSLEKNDLADLRLCRVGNCGVKLPVEAIERLGREVDWSLPDHATRANLSLRETILRYMEAYSRRGDAALIEYRDKSKPVPLAREFRAVLDAQPGLDRLAPEFYEDLIKYPSQSLPGVGDFFYWSTETFDLKPVSSVTHVSIYSRPEQAVAISKQIYASHYFDASLGLTAALDVPGGMYLVYLNRSRIDLLSGFFGALRRAVLRGRLGDGLRKNLAEAVRKLESSCANYSAADPAAR